MKKYFSIFTFLFLTTFNPATAALNFDLTDYTDDGYYATLTGIDRGDDAVAGLKSLFESQGFNPSKDTNIVRASFAGFVTRKAFVKLSDEHFTDVVSNSLPFFSTPYGFSLIHGWMLNKFRESTTPYYIGRYFSFDKFFWGMVNAMPVTVLAVAKDIIKRAWWSARAEIEANRWGYYDNMLYLPYAIEQAQVAKTGIQPTIDRVIADSRTSEKTDLAFINKSQEDFLTYVQSSMQGWNGSSYIPNAEEKFQNIIGWLLNRYNLDALLPARQNIASVNAFVEFVVEHVKGLYRDPINDASLENVTNIKLVAIRSQPGEILRNFLVNGILPQFKVTYTNDNYTLEAINRGLRLVRINTTRPAPLVQTPAVLLPIYAIVSGAGAAPRPFSATSPSKLSPGMAQKMTPGSEKSKLEHLGVYPTPLMVQWMDAPPLNISAYEIADILKYFESYLDKVKRGVSENADCGPYTGNIGSKVYLSEVKAWRYRILAGGDKPEVRAAGLQFINDKRSQFFKSLKSQGMAE